MLGVSNSKSNPTIIRTARHYMKHPKDAFMHGFFTFKKIKSIGNVAYKQHHYFLPSVISPSQKAIKEYFLALDHEYKEVPSNYRYRQNPVEFYETAIQCLDRIRRFMDLDGTLVAGSQLLSPIAWAVFGVNKANRLARHTFTTFTDIFNKYDPLMRPVEGSGYNVASVMRPKSTDEDNDTLTKISEIVNLSPNYVLGCAIMLLYDLICNSGPDCEDFPEICKNDKRSIPFINTEDAWINVRAKTMPVNPIDFGPFIGKSSKHSSIIQQKYFDFRGGLNFKHKTNTSLPVVKKEDYNDYYEVEFIDVHKPMPEEADVLNLGEKFEFHYELEKNLKKKKDKTRSKVQCVEKESQGVLTLDKLKSGNANLAVDPRVTNLYSNSLPPSHKKQNKKRHHTKK